MRHMHLKNSDFQEIMVTLFRFCCWLFGVFFNLNLLQQVQEAPLTFVLKYSIRIWEAQALKEFSETVKMTSHNWELYCWSPAVSPQWNYLVESSTIFITVFANIMFNSSTPGCQTPLCTANIFLYCKNQLKPVNFQEYTVDHISMSNCNCRVSKCHVRAVLHHI